ncbi:MAG: STAS domain-containing protein [Phycisphaerales bacterium]
MAESSFIRAERVGNAVVIEILSEQIGDRESQIIQAEIAAVAEPVGWRLAIDMTRVAFLASAGLGTLVSAHNAAKAAKGKMAVCHIAPDLMKMLELTRLDRLFTIKPDRDAAIKVVG